MAYVHDTNFFGSIVDFVDDPVIADAYSPIVPGAYDLAASGRTGIIRQCLDRAYDARKDILGKTAEISFRSFLKQDLVHVHFSFKKS